MKNENIKIDNRSEQPHRKQIPQKAVLDAVCETKVKILEQLLEKGFGTWTSRHEILGIVEEEQYELTKAVHAEDLNGVKSELLDVAVACIFAVACINEGTLDW